MMDELRNAIRHLHPVLAVCEVEIIGNDRNILLLKLPYPISVELINDRQELRSKIVQVARNFRPELKSLRVVCDESLATRVEKVTKEVRSPSLPRETGKLLTIPGGTIPLGFTFDSYIVSDFNRKAYLSIIGLFKNVVSNDLTVSMDTSFFIYAPSGMGKSHLATALAWETLGAGLNVAFFQGSRLRAFLIEDILGRRYHFSSFLKAVSNVSLMVIDDFQSFHKHIPPKLLDSIYQLVFDLFIACFTGGIPVVTTSDTHLNTPLFASIPERVRSRLALQGLLEIRPHLDPQFVVSYLDYVENVENVKFDPSFREFMIRYVEERFVSVRQIVSFVKTICSMAEAFGKRIISEKDALEVHASLFPPRSREQSIEVLFREVCEYIGLSQDEQVTLRSLRSVRNEKLGEAYRLFICLAKKKGYSVTEIASFFGKSRGTIGAALKRCPEMEVRYKYLFEVFMGQIQNSK